MQHLIFCKKCNHHTTVNHLEWTAIICQSCGAEIASQTYIDLLLEKIENRDLNLAHRDHLIDELERQNSEYMEVSIQGKEDRDRLIAELESHNRVLTRILEKVAESIPANELSRRMYGFTTDEEGNIREVAP